MNPLRISALEVNDYHVTYECPFCFTKYNKNGQPSKRAKNHIHQHGNLGNKKIGSHFVRVTHCYDKGLEKSGELNISGVDIEITSDTIGSEP